MDQTTVSVSADNTDQLTTRRNRSFFTVLTRAHHRTTPWAKWIQSTFPTLGLEHYYAIIFNIILPSMSRSPKWHPPIMISDKHFLNNFHVSHACYIPCPSHPSWFYHRKYLSKWLTKQLTNWPVLYHLRELRHPQLIRYGTSSFIIGANNNQCITESLSIVHIITTYLPNDHFNIILLRTVFPELWKHVSVISHGTFADVCRCRYRIHNLTSLRNADEHLTQTIR